MSDSTSVSRDKAKAWNIVLRRGAGAWFAIPVLLMCACTHTPVKHYTLASQGPPRPNEEAVFTATEKPAFKPFVKIDGHEFSVGSQLEEALVDGFLQPFSEPQMRSLEVRLLPGPHKVNVAIAYIGSWSLPFSKGRTINFEANAGKTYRLQFKVIQFNDHLATGNIEWGTKVIEVETGKEFESEPDSASQQAKS